MGWIQGIKSAVGSVHIRTNRIELPLDIWPLVSPVDRLSDFVPFRHLTMSAKKCAEAQIAPTVYQEPKCVSVQIFLLRDRRYEQRSMATTLLQNEN